MKNLTSMYRVFRYTKYPQYWPAEATVYVDIAPGTVEEYVTDLNGVPKLIGNYVGTVTYANYASFPTTGKVNRMYIDASTNYLYRWDGSAYVAISSASTGGVNKGTTSGTDTYTVSIPTVSSYSTNDLYIIKFANANTGAATLNISGLGAKTLVKNNNVALVGGDIQAGQEFAVIYDGTNMQVIGIAPNQMFAFVTNAESTQITKGQVVYAYGATGDRMSVKLASNLGDPTSAKTIGLVFSSTIAANGTGYIITQGVIQNLNLGSYTAGDTLYLDSTAGGFTKVKPHAPNHLVYIGIVERANSGNGQIYVRPQNGYELDEIHDVDLYSTAPVNNDILTYITGTNNLWKPRSIASILGFTPYSDANPAGYITSSALSPYLTSATAASTYQPIGTYATAGNSMTFTNKSGNISQWTNDSGYLTSITSLQITTALGYTPVTNVRTISTTGPLSGGGDLSANRTISIIQADSSNDGYLSAIDWNTFNSKQEPITLTTTGTSGPATLVGSILNIPQYSGGGGSYTFSTGLTNTSGTVTADLSTGKSGGQVVYGGTAASEDLYLSSTSDSTKDRIFFGAAGTSAYSELNDRLGIGTNNPGSKLTVVNGSTATVGLSVSTTATSNQAAVFNATNSSTASNVTACVYTVMTLNPTASAAASNRALYMSVQLNSSNDSAFTANPSAGFFECRVLRAGAITDLTGGTFFGVFIPSSGVTGTINITRTTGINVQAAYSGQPGLTGTISNARAIWITNSNISASSVALTFQVGITMDNLTAATNNTALLLGTTTIPSGNWAIHSTTTNSSYLAGSLGLGTTPSYKLDVNGTGRFSSALTTTGRIQAYSKKTSNYTLTGVDRIIAGDTTTAGFTLTLPTHVVGTEYTIYKHDSTGNVLTVVPTSGLIGISSSWTANTQYKSITVVSDGTNWIIVAGG